MAELRYNKEHVKAMDLLIARFTNVKKENSIKVFFLSKEKYNKIVMEKFNKLSAHEKNRVQNAIKRVRKGRSAV